MTGSLAAGFLRSVERFPERPALAIQRDQLSYRELFNQAAAIAATLQEFSAPDRAGRLTGVFGHRSFAAFAGVLAALLRGDGYVPLNPAFPSGRNADMATRARLDWVVAEHASLPALERCLEDIPGPISILVPDATDLGGIERRWPRHRFYSEADLVSADQWTRPDVDPDGIAYLLFTSGSTGIPKGVMVAHRNVTHFVSAMVERYKITESDRFSQTFDLTFDLSAFDMFVAWERGACLCCPTQQEKLFPSKYVKSQELTIWFSVPSTAVMMNRLRMLKPGAFPSIRYSLFCGEALPLEVTEVFQRAAPDSVVENLYGPTELTIACTLYRYETGKAAHEAHLGLVPIGEPYPGMTELIVNEQLEEVPPGQPGELLMTGPQLTLGYWEDEERTRKAFVQPPGKTRTYYRTGDRVVRQPGGGPLVYLGRVDNQIKIQGYRVELGEIEAVLREEAGTDVAIAIGYPQGPSGAEGIVGFVSRPGADLALLREAVGSRLPSYMQPAAIHHVEEFPLNPNGKVDRNALLAALREAASREE